MRLESDIVALAVIDGARSSDGCVVVGLRDKSLLVADQRQTIVHRVLCMEVPTHILPLPCRNSFVIVFPDGSFHFQTDGKISKPALNIKGLREMKHLSTNLLAIETQDSLQTYSIDLTHQKLVLVQTLTQHEFKDFSRLSSHMPANTLLYASDRVLRVYTLN